MITQPEALRLAEWLEGDGGGLTTLGDCAAELRRLSEIETLYLAAMRGRHAMSEELRALTAQRDALLETLKDAAEAFELASNGGGVDFYAYAQQFREDIAKAEENT